MRWRVLLVVDEGFLCPAERERTRRSFELGARSRAVEHFVLRDPRNEAPCVARCGGGLKRVPRAPEAFR